MLKTKILLALFLVVGVLSSCKKELSPEKQAVKDDGIIVDFIAKNNIVAKKHNSGLYYQIISSGSGTTPTLANDVTVKYEGRLLNGSIFDESKPTYTLLLNDFIQGWKIGIPLIKKGGEIRLIIPSALAYGNQSRGSAIPKNSVLDFTVKLIDVN